MANDIYDKHFGYPTSFPMPVFDLDFSDQLIKPIDFSSNMARITSILALDLSLLLLLFLFLFLVV